MTPPASPSTRRERWHDRSRRSRPRVHRARRGAAPRASPAQEFGKNQVEYHAFDWQVIETEHFTVHYYPQEATAAMDVARMAERAYSRLARVFQWEFREKKPIMLFASRADFGENLVTGDLGEGTGGVTELQRHRMLFFFTGNYRTTEHVLTHEMVHEFQYDIFAKGKAGGGYREMAGGQSAALVHGRHGGVPVQGARTIRTRTSSSATRR